MKQAAQQLRIKYKELSIKNLVTRLRVIRYQILTSGDTGFTLVEILVAITILATLAGGVMLSLNPIAQIQKGQDAQKQADLQSIKTALDLYYSDNNCYPKAEDGIAFGNEWRVGETVYMKKVPQDPNCKAGKSCYRYRTVTDLADPTVNCPQWNVVFAELGRSSTISNACPLTSLSSCVPSDFGNNNSRYACVMLGTVNCGSLATTTIGGGTIETILPTPTTNPCSASSNRSLECACTNDAQCGSQNCDVTVGTHTGTNLCKPLSEKYDPNDISIPLPQSTNPDPYEVILNNGTNTFQPNPGAVLTVKLKIIDPGVTINTVEVGITGDGLQQETLTLSAPIGAANNAGTWVGSKQLPGDITFYNLYALEFLIKAGNGATAITGYETIGLKGTGLK